MDTIQQIKRYIMEHLETNNPIFSNMPPCPFARKERLEDRIEYQEVHIGAEGPNDALIERIRSFDRDPSKSTMIIYDPHQLCCLNSAYEFALQIGNKLADIDILAIPLHPADPFSVRGFRTRQTPFMMMTIQRKSLIHNAKRKLLGTAYYSKWDDFEERYLERFEEYMHETHPETFFVRLWWKSEILKSLQHGSPEPEPIIGTTVEALTRNELHFWMHKWGKIHGWKPLCPIRDNTLQTVQEALKKGFCVIGTAHGGMEPGLLVCAEQHADELRFFPELETSWLHKRWSGGSYFWSFDPSNQRRSLNQSAVDTRDRD